MINFTSSIGQRTSWEPRTEKRHYVRFQYMVMGIKDDLYFPYGASFFGRLTLEETRKGFAELQAKYPDLDWAAACPAIVKAPCAFDAREHFVFVEAL